MISPPFCLSLLSPSTFGVHNSFIHSLILQQKIVLLSSILYRRQDQFQDLGSYDLTTMVSLYGNLQQRIFWCMKKAGAVKERKKAVYCLSVIKMKVATILNLSLGEVVQLWTSPYPWGSTCGFGISDRVVDEVSMNLSKKSCSCQV